MDIEATMVAVLAAGLSTRFGGDKLLHPLGSKPLAAHIADTLADLPFQSRLAIVPADNPARRSLFADAGFETLENPSPGRGLSTSLQLAADHAQKRGATALLVCLADMPFVTAAFLRQLVGQLQGDAQIIATSAGTLRSPPVVFGAAALPALSMVEGDKGARDLIATARTVEAPPAMMMDFDRREDFERA